MKALSCALALLTAAALTASAEAGALHTGKGTVLSVDAGAGRVVMTHDPGGRHVLALDAATRIVDETGSPIPAAALQAGDTVREECVLRDGGPALAKQIRLLRRAWMDTASPEM